MVKYQNNANVSRPLIAVLPAHENAPFTIIFVRGAGSAIYFSSLKLNVTNAFRQTMKTTLTCL